MRTYTRTGLFSLLLAVSVPAPASEIFRWVDQHGKVHYGDSVSVRNASKSQRVAIRDRDITEDEKKEVEQRLAKDKARLKALASEKKEPAAEPILSIAPPAVSQQKSARIECARKRRAFVESEACFAPFRLANGGIKAEAFARCSQTKMPDC